MEKIKHHHIQGYQVTAIQQPDLQHLIICFGDSGAAGLEGSGFGSQISLGLRKGWSMLFVTPLKECWYQNADALWALLSDWVERASHVIAIGSEMGSVGAMRMADLMRVDDAILFSPVAELNSRKGPQDWRFDDAYARLGQFQPVGCHGASRYAVFYDPGSPEKRHLEALGIADDLLTTLPMPGTAGRCLRMLSRQPVWEDFLHSRLSETPMPALRPDLRAARRSAPHYLETLFYRNLEARSHVSGWALARMQTMQLGSDLLLRMENAFAEVA